MNTSLLAGIATTVVVFALVLWLLLAVRNHRNNRFAAEQAAQQEARNQLITQLMKTSLNDRMTVAITALGMINAGPHKLITPAMANLLPWHLKFMQEFCAVAYANRLGTYDALKDLEYDSYDEALNTLARSPEFMLFAARNSRHIDEYLDVYYNSPEEIPRQVRSNVFSQLVTKEYLDELITILTAKSPEAQDTTV